VAAAAAYSVLYSYHWWPLPLRLTVYLQQRRKDWATGKRSSSNYYNDQSVLDGAWDRAELFILRLWVAERPHAPPAPVGQGLRSTAGSDEARAERTGRAGACACRGLVQDACIGGLPPCRLRARRRARPHGCQWWRGPPSVLERNFNNFEQVRV
jgi:hypothetical protein